MFMLLSTTAALLPRVVNTFGGEESRAAADGLTWAWGWDADHAGGHLYDPFGSATGGRGRFQAARFAHDELAKVHFDDLASTARINLMWRRYLGGTVAGLLWAADRGDVAAARNIVGAGLHAMQDFYSHSNWVDLSFRRRTWFEVPAADRNAMQLYTGTYEREVPEPGTGDLIELGKKLFGNAQGLALRNSVQWLEQLHTIMARAGHAAFWRRVRAEWRTGAQAPRSPSAEPAGVHWDEQPNKLPITFLSAGAYPPHPAGSDEGWFVRLELRTADQFGAGTNSGIDAAIGGRRFRLGPGGDQNRLLEHGGFEPGKQTWCLVGPFEKRPTEITFYNDGTDRGDSIAAVWADFESAVSPKVAWSWAELAALAGTPGTEFEVLCDGGAAGESWVRGHLSVQRTPAGELRAAVRLTELLCATDGDRDHGSGSGDPFVLMLVDSPAADQLVAFRTGPFSDVDQEETRGIDMKPIMVDVPRYGGLIVPVQAWGSAEDGTDGPAGLLRGFAAKYGEDTREPRSRFLDAIGEAIMPDWKPAAIDAYAFHRGPVVKTTHLARNRPIDRWLEAGGSLTIPFGKTATRTLAVPALAPAITSRKLLDGGITGVAPAGGVVYAAGGPPQAAGEPPVSGTLFTLGSHLEPDQTAPGGQHTRSVAVDPVRNRLYVVNSAVGVAMLDATTLQTLAAVTLGRGLIDVAVDPATGLVYVSQSLTGPGGGVHVLSADDLAKVALVTEPSGFYGPHGLAVDSAAQRIYVARDFRLGGPCAPAVTALSVIHRRDDGRHVIERTVPLGEQAVRAIDVAVDPAAGLVYVAGLGGADLSPRLMVLDRAKHTLLGHVPIPGGSARAVAARPGTGMAYVVGEGGLTVVDAAGRAREITHRLGRRPWTVAVDPDTGVAYVGDRVDGTVTRIEPLDGIG
jgi:DNA-binding beta-propeller fold protein YncE